MARDRGSKLNILPLYTIQWHSYCGDWCMSWKTARYETTKRCIAWQPQRSTAIVLLNHDLGLRTNSLRKLSGVGIGEEEQQATEAQ